MKILSWVQTKLRVRGKQQEGGTGGIKRPILINCCTSQKMSNEEKFSDWSDRLLLAIGTLGAENINLQDLEDNHDSSAAIRDQIQRELVKLIMINRELEDDSVSLDYYLKQLSCLENDGRSPSCVLMSKKKGLGRKSLSLLINKIFMSKKAAFAPTSSLRDPFPDNSRMEKILRALMQKKIYPQNSAPNSNAKKYLENGDNEHEFHTEKCGSKWVKTDSEYIVLEI